MKALQIGNAINELSVAWIIIFLCISLTSYPVGSCVCYSLGDKPCSIKKMEVCDVNLESSPLPPGAPRDLSIRHFVAKDNNGLNISFYPPDDGSITYLQGFQVKLLHTEGKSMNKAECYKVNIRNGKHTDQLSSKPKIYFDCFRGLPQNTAYFIQVTSLPLPVSGPWKTQEGFYEISRFRGVSNDDPCSWQPFYFSVIVQPTHFRITFNLAPSEFVFQTYKIELYNCTKICRGPLDQKRVNSTEVHLDPIELNNTAIKEVKIYQNRISGLHFLTVRGCRLKESGMACPCSRKFRTSGFYVAGRSQVGDKTSLGHAPEIERLAPSTSSVLQGDVIAFQESRVTNHSRWNLLTLPLGVLTLICFATGLGIMYVYKYRASHKKNSSLDISENPRDPEVSKKLIETNSQIHSALMIYSEDSEQHWACIQGFSQLLEKAGWSILPGNQHNHQDFSHAMKTLDLCDKVVIIHSKGVFAQSVWQKPNEASRCSQDHLVAFGHFIQNGIPEKHANKIVNVKFDCTSSQDVISSLLIYSRCYSIPTDLSDFIKDFDLYSVDSDIKNESIYILSSTVKQAEVLDGTDLSNRYSKHSDDSYDSGLGSPSTPSELPMIHNLASIFTSDTMFQNDCHTKTVYGKLYHDREEYMCHILPSEDAGCYESDDISCYESSGIRTLDSDPYDAHSNVPLRRDSDFSLGFMPPNITSESDDLSDHSGISEAYEKLLAMNGVT